MSAALLRRQLLRACSLGLFAVLACSATLSAQTLAWNANTESNLAGYVVQYGTQSGSPTTSVDVGNVTSRAMTGLAPGSTYYFRVVAYNTTGQQSAPSSQVSYTVPALPATPTLTAVSPASGPTAGGTTITLTGTNFASGATVRVGGTAATNVVFVSATQLTARTPAGTAGARDVQVTNPNGQSVTRTGAFTYTTGSGTPGPLTVSPSSGPRTGGTTITLTGSGFAPGTSVKIDGASCSNVVVISATLMTAVTPASPGVGPREVRVGTPTERLTLPSGFTYTDTTTSQMTAFTSYLAEGVQSAEMRTQLAIANPESTDAQVNLTFMDTTGQATELAVDVPARSRQTVDLSTVPQLAGTSFSTRVDANQPVAVDRLVSIDAQGGSALLETAVADASPAWYFAEGSTVDPFELFYLVQNPGTTPARVQVRYLLPNRAPVTRIHDVAPGSRATIWVDREDPAIAATELAAEITSVDGTPIVVERSLYVKEQGSAQPRGGDTSTGVTAPATHWSVEGTTGRFALRLLLANPGAEASQVQVAYRRADGRTLTRAYALAANSRQSIDVASVHPSLANAAVGITVDATAPIVVERTTSWGANGMLDGAVSGAGSTGGGARWLLAEAEQGGARNATTNVVVVNQGAATDVTVTLLFEDGPEATATFPVAAGGRLAVPMAEAFPGAEGRRFSVLVEGADPAATLVVERAIFWQAGGARTAGADGAASRLR